MLETLTNYFTYSENNLMDNTLLNICSQLSELGYEDKIEIPQIVVCATQSAGKSNTLNNIINYQILPVGKVMTTKTPIRVELRNNDKEDISIGYIVNSNFIEKYSYLLNKIDYDIIENNITTITNTFIGDEYGISNKEIIIKLNSKNIPNLNLIDLPGLIAINKTEVDTKSQIRNLVKEYILKPNIIILGIFPARLDLETDYGLELIKECDPNFERTIGCLTKIDLLQNENMSDYLTNNISDNLKLKYGYFAIKNTGDETSYFKTHPVYSKMCEEKLGITHLTKRLTKILIDKVSIILPSILDNINEKLEEINTKLIAYGEDIISDDKDYMLNTIIHRFTQSFISSLDNNIIDMNYSKILKKTFIDYREEVENIKAFEDLTNENIDNLLINNEKNQMFIEINYIDILEKIFKNNIKSFNILKNISINCSKQIHIILFELIDRLIKYNNLNNYDNLIIHIKNVVKEKLDEQMIIIETEINNLILFEKSYLWTENKNFIEKYNQIKLELVNNKYIIKELCITYFNTIKDTFQNIVPKLIMHSLIRTLENNMSSLLLSNNTFDLLTENPHIINDRISLKNEKKKLAHIKNNIKNILI
jgi:hypothetical protein